MALLEAKNLTCIKRDRVLFKGLTVQVNSGEIWHLTGANGAGKTSLLNILVGLSRPQQGKVQIAGQDVEQAQYAHKLLFVGHHLALNGQLSAVENLQFWCRLQQCEIPADWYAMLALLGLVGLEHQPVSQLSAGQQRRVALCRLWLTQATLWVLDEPFTALDSQAIELIQQKIKQHCDQGGGVLLTSHQPLSSQLQSRSLHLEYLW